MATSHITTPKLYTSARRVYFSWRRTSGALNEVDISDTILWVPVVKQAFLIYLQHGVPTAVRVCSSFSLSTTRDRPKSATLQRQCSSISRLCDFKSLDTETQLLVQQWRYVAGIYLCTTGGEQLCR